jgi:hypothetical protein
LLLTNLVNKTLNDSKATISINALGLSTLVVGECPKDTLPLARDCSAIEVTKTNVALARSEGLTRTKRQSEVIRRQL